MRRALRSDGQRMVDHWSRKKLRRSSLSARADALVRIPHAMTCILCPSLSRKQSGKRRKSHCKKRTGTAAVVARVSKARVGGPAAPVPSRPNFFSAEFPRTCPEAGLRHTIPVFRPPFPLSIVVIARSTVDSTAEARGLDFGFWKRTAKDGQFKSVAPRTGNPGWVVGAGGYKKVDDWIGQRGGRPQELHIRHKVDLDYCSNDADGP